MEIEHPAQANDAIAIPTQPRNAMAAAIDQTATQCNRSSVSIDIDSIGAVALLLSSGGAGPRTGRDALPWLGDRTQWSPLASVTGQTAVLRAGLLAAPPPPP